MTKLEDDLAATTDPKEHARIKTQAIQAALAGIPAPQRLRYVLDGYTVQLLAPSVVRDAENRIIGLETRLAVTDPQGNPLPFGPTNDVHRIINPPTKVWKGAVDGEGNRIYEEDLVGSLRRILLDAALDEAKRQGYVVP